MTESTELDIDSLRNPSELPHHWRLRKEFLNVHQGKFNNDRLISLSHLFVNIKCLGLSYPQEVMDNVERLAKTIDTKLIEEASVEESLESHDSDIGSDESQPHQQQYQQSPVHYNSGGNNYNNHRNNNQWRNHASNQPFSRPYSRSRFQQSNQDNRRQPYQQQNQQSYQPQQPQYHQQHDQQPQQFARYSEQQRFFRPQELRPRSERSQGSGNRQPFYRPRHRGAPDRFDRRNQE